MNVPDSPVPLRAFRVWGVGEDAEGPLLSSTASGFDTGMPLWPPRERMTARCLSRSSCGQDAPNPTHSCGIYALGDLDAALEWAAAMARVRPIVVGEVWCWGRVVEAERGWRAEHAYPATLTTVVARRRRGSVRPRLLANLADRYAVDVAAP